MPEVLMDVEWPDGGREWLYSPSTVVEDVFAAGAEYPLPVFLELTRQAMTEASDRVQARFGFRCPRAAATLAGVEATAARLTDGSTDGVVRVAGFRR
ncbi:MSMEG_0570 family nitrogen starvation response protein [Blastococcus saxobsidens]|uniref:MSMEG_0570 family nitrogen starvation response protein n=1 Tax=Blastococcus saxobsidens TaxID=138336 RepID=A0A6L9VZ82_9ACTN|nr:MSMEG_0570 family nitrogen starvation response protein [Blastococcus saxobsidens]NEK85105.1 MSMEG_0570 family nitrogen starvation response protein [Blastococcus saxobsidens]